MSGAIATAAIVAGGIGAAGSLGGAALASSGANKAAQTQANAANQAAQLQYQASQNALDFQKQQWNTTQQQMQPWLQAGTSGVDRLSYLLGLNPSGGSSARSSLSPAMNMPYQANAQPGQSQVFNPNGSLPVPPANSYARMSEPMTFDPTTGNVTASPQPSGASPALQLQTGGPNTLAQPSGSPGGGFGSLLTPYSGHFTAPTDITEQNDPGYQARLKLGTDAIQRSAAARGGILTGGTAKALNQFGQDYASNEYGNVYNRALTGFQTDYNQYNNDQNTIFNRLAAISGVGQNAANNLASVGQNTANAVSSNLLGTAANMGQQYNNAAAANASGIAAGTNAWGNAIGGVGNNLSSLYMLGKLNAGNPYKTLYGAQNPNTSNASVIPYDLSGISIG